jgi:hypothetical protein
MAPVVPVPLDQISSAGTGARPNQCTFPPADQCASKQTDPASNQRSLSPAVMRSTVAARIPSLSIDTKTSERPHHDCQQQERG